MTVSMQESETPDYLVIHIQKVNPDKVTRQALADKEQQFKMSRGVRYTRRSGTHTEQSLSLSIDYRSAMGAGPRKRFM